MQIFLIRVKLSHWEGGGLWGLLYGGKFNYLSGVTMSPSSHAVFLPRINTQMCFPRSSDPACVCMPRTYALAQMRLRVMRVGLSVNTQRPQELPRALRTASVCVLVPSKQGNLENTKRAANKHNLIPPSSCTWLWILQCHSKDTRLS